ncbi:primosomal protein N' [Microbulbifer thermotolerans]|uniref:Replication restart protein PriA n=1 Tax=Microbulbifer thermotolerans TaxID=252514 RepID=A0AB35HVR3_MICTH|nr:primosomal protein N' [Microbulbifer thermotolerans]MCX2783784.1 primosomal protein N' [Microbulbifer thermotolerans]MCX2801627.1 primosomal protein N' [Microbulbifer thermotolerans]MCX2830668.1 primosomal protein N' [Microbulbifer thermotolerans]MCX2833273.1 primosomal protein N' [Microbulbifer thermotolerans]WKT60478.1 primosomal protein N' [Microbulbifer thermotolerans]
MLSLGIRWGREAGTERNCYHAAFGLAVREGQLADQGAKAVILRMAVPVPLRRLFDYLPPEGLAPSDLIPGQRLWVPFANRKLVAVLVDIVSDSPLEQLKPAVELIDRQPLFDGPSRDFLHWAADYYQAPVGEIYAAALPVALRKGKPADHWAEQWLQLTVEGKGLPESALARAPRQQALLQLLLRRGAQSRTQLKAQGHTTATIRALEERGLAECSIGPTVPPPISSAESSPAPELNPEQQQVLEAIPTDRFTVSLLEGTTGSGKTEVYLRLMERVLAEGRQALLLVPEIGLTPQTLRRIAARFPDRSIAALHSGLAEGERAQAWLSAAAGQADIVIGTRSAVLTPLPRLGAVIVDEEHDGSFKQQDGVRYSARDLAVVLGRNAGAPVLLGSATPSLESLHNALTGRYQHLRLRNRAGNARPPQIHIVPTLGQPLEEGFTPQVLRHIGDTLSRGEQVLVFINRRGFAPALACDDCGWLADCPHCSSKLTMHRRIRQLRCHHCDYRRALVDSCPQCHSRSLSALGGGTERSEELLGQRFADYPVIRVDRDTTASKQALDRLLAPAREGEPCLLLGTQMLAKGHHLPRVTLVVIQDADGGLFSADFRAPERTGQLLEQVAGRAGRGDLPGRVLVQSRYPQHPLLQLLLEKGYGAFARQLLRDRAVAQLPPHRAMALVRAECEEPRWAEEFLEAARAQMQALAPPSPQLSYLGPVPALLERKSGRFRFYVQVTAERRGQLQPLLARLCQWAEGYKNRRLRWAVDMDAQELS